MAKAKTPRDDSLQAILARKKSRTIEFPICTDADLADARDLAKKQVDDLTTRAKARRMMAERADPGSAKDTLVSQADALDAELEVAIAAHAKAEAAAEEVTDTFVFRALGRKVLEVMMRHHKPTASQIAEVQAEQKANGQPLSSLDFNPETFPVALIAAACASPQMTLDEAQELWDSDVFSQAELRMMFQTAWAVNNMVSQ